MVMIAITVPIRQIPHQHPISQQTQTQHKKRKKKLTTIQRTTQHIIKLAPPRKVPLADNILEHEANHEPTAIIDTRGRWDPRDTVEDDGGGDPLDPRVGVAAAPEPKGDGQDGPNDDRVEVGVVHRACAKLAGWTDQTPARQDVQSVSRFLCVKKGEGDAYQMALAVKNTWLCGHVSWLDWFLLQISGTLLKIQCLTPT
jgi:hypothetical protein